MADTDAQEKRASDAFKDMFKDSKPYYGSPILETGEKVPSLFALTVYTVMKDEINFAGVDSVPPVLKNKLEYYKQYEEFKGPKIYKCSVCGKFYTNSEKFNIHECS